MRTLASAAALLVLSSLCAASAPYYGVDARGGSTLHGRVFTLDCKNGLPCGMPTLYSFCPPGNLPCPDGADPEGGLVVVSDTKIIGTTLSGGKNSGVGQGVLFELTRPSKDSPKWIEKVLRAFCTDGIHCIDGGNPYGNLELKDGVIRGVTKIGGAHAYGTAFSFDLATGSYTILAPFYPPP